MKINFISIIESKIFFLIISIFYKFCLDWSYFKFVSPLFSYAGFELNFKIFNYISSYVLTVVLILFTPNLLKQVSDYVLVIFAFCILIPLFTLYGFNSNYSFYPILVNFLVYFVLYLGLKVRLTDKRVVYPYISNGEGIFKTFCLFMIFYLVAWYIVSGAVSNFNLDVSKVYEFRDENAELTNLGILSYFNSWVLKVFSLALIAYSLMKKKYFLFIFLLILQVFFYGVSAHKSVLFSPLLVFGIYFYLSKTRSLATVPLLFSSLIVLCMGLYTYNENATLASMLVRRIFFVPNYLTFIYFDYFSNNPFAYWTNTFSFIGPAVYPNGIPSTVGSYLGSDELRANNGFISSGFAQAGIIGVAIYTFLFLFILKVINQISREVGYLWFTLCIVITPLRTALISSDLLTVLLTHGLIFAIFLLILLRKSSVKNDL